MQNSKSDLSALLDPWTASSLLQKAIRRGERQLAIEAVRALYRFRGKGVWRRLINIALEDVGIADPGLINDLTCLALDQRLREVLGSENGLLSEFVTKLAAAPKDRSADYLFCAATKLPRALTILARLKNAGFRAQLELAADASQPLLNRAVAALATCSIGHGSQIAIEQKSARALLSGLRPPCADGLTDALDCLAGKSTHPFVLILPLLSSVHHARAADNIFRSDAIPDPEWYQGIPLYTFDKHTAAGKLAIKRFEVVPDFWTGC